MKEFHIMVSPFALSVSSKKKAIWREKMDRGRNRMLNRYTQRETKTNTCSDGER